MQPIKLESAINAIVRSDPRFDPGAFHLVRESLDFTVERMAKNGQGEKRHVTGRELLTGFREFALQEYGPMAATLLADWGIKSCRNVGEIVFLLIDCGVFGKQDSDSLDDFSEIYTFEEAFSAPFQVKS